MSIVLPMLAIALVLGLVSRPRPATMLALVIASVLLAWRYLH